MGLIPGYEFDIFISYVHDDNISELQGEDGWVSKFYKYLDTKLKKHHRDITIWWDSKSLDRSELFDKSIKEALDNSAIFISLYSRRYLQSAYCVKELNHFYDKAQAEEFGLQIGNRSRIIPILLSNIPYTEWPDKLSGTSGFKFHDAENEKEYGDPLVVDTFGPFNDEMKLLRDALVNIFNDATAPKQEESKQLPLKKVDFSICFGGIADALVDRSKGIKSQLEGEGFTVNNYYDLNSLDVLQDFDLIVHLLDDSSKEDIKMLECLKASLQLDVPKIIWLPNYVKLDLDHNVTAIKHVSNLENDSKTINYEIIQGNEGELFKVIRDYIRQLQDAEQFIKKSALSSTPDSSERTTVKVVLDTHIKDFSYAFNLRKSLINNNIELIFNPEDGDPQENIELLYENVSEAEKFIFLYGDKDNSEWINYRVEKTMQKLVEYGRFTQDIFIFMAPPPKEKESIRSANYPLVKIVDQSTLNNGNIDLNGEFVHQLKSDN